MTIILIGMTMIMIIIITIVIMEAIITMKINMDSEIVTIVFMTINIFIMLIIGITKYSGTTKVRNSGLGPDPDLSAKSGPE